MKIQLKTQNGRIIELSEQQLKKLAQTGRIKPDTAILVDGKEVSAGRIKGLVFGESGVSVPQSSTGASPADGEFQNNPQNVLADSNSKKERLEWLQTTRDMIRNNIVSIVTVAVIAVFVISAPIGLSVFVDSFKKPDDPDIPYRTFGEFVKLLILPTLCAGMLAAFLTLIAYLPTKLIPRRLFNSRKVVCSVVVYLIIVFLAIFIPVFHTMYSQFSVESAFRLMSDNERQQVGIENQARAAEEKVKSQKRKSQSDAFVAACTAVQTKLINPKSAKFCLFREASVTENSDGSMTVRGWVENTNAFNATVRQKWSINLVQSGNNWKVKLGPVFSF